MAAFDLVIKDGMIFDGRGTTPRYRADIGVKDGIITRIGRIPESDAARVVDASGLNVAPGFVDVHTHYDSQVFWDPYCSWSSWHGCTTVMIGNCGFGFAPVAEDMRDRAMLAMTRNEQVPLVSMQLGMPWDWVTYPEFLDSVERTPKGVNIHPFVPVGPLMIWVMGLERAKSGVVPTDDEHAEMRRLLRESMLAGGAGITAQRLGEGSIQPDYDGSPMVTDLMHTETMVELAKVLGELQSGAIQYTYFADQDDRAQYFDDGGMVTRAGARAEFERLAEISGRPVMPVHFPADRPWIDECRARGLQMYPQDGGQFGLGPSGTELTFRMTDDHLQLFTSPVLIEAFSGSKEHRLAALAEPAVREEIRRGMRLVRVAVVERAATEAMAKYNGRKLADIAEEQGKKTYEVFIDLLLADDLGTEFSISVPSRRTPAQQKAMLEDKYALWGISDGGAHVRSLLGSSWPTNLLNAVRDHAWMTLEEAHWRMSALPAQACGNRDRGVITEGAPADIVVYDFENLALRPKEVVVDFPGEQWRVVQKVDGYRCIIVNGEITFEDGACTGATPGTLDRHGRSGLPGFAARPASIEVPPTSRISP